MHRAIPVLALVVLGLLLASAPAMAQAQPATQTQPPLVAPKFSEELAKSWESVGNKVIVMAGDFPEDKYDFKPNPQVRSFAEVLLHIATADRMFISVANGQKMSGGGYLRKDYSTKASVVDVLKKSVADGAAAIRAMSDADLMQAIKNPFSGQMTSKAAWIASGNEHSGEHYGQLVVYYRVNGLVPPSSRRQQE